jgi:hypothetical protein
MEMEQAIKVRLWFLFLLVVEVIVLDFRGKPSKNLKRFKAFSASHACPVTCSSLEGKLESAGSVLHPSSE